MKLLNLSDKDDNKKQLITQTIAIILNMLCITYFLGEYQNVTYYSNFMVIYEVLQWITVPLIVLIAFFFYYFINNKKYHTSELLKSFEKMNDVLNREKVNTFINRTLFAIAIISVGVVGGDWSLFTPMAISFVFISWFRNLIKTGLPKIEESIK